MVRLSGIAKIDCASGDSRKRFGQSEVQCMEERRLFDGDIQESECGHVEDMGATTDHQYHGSPSTALASRLVSLHWVQWSPTETGKWFVVSPDRNECRNPHLFLRLPAIKVCALPNLTSCPFLLHAQQDRWSLNMGNLLTYLGVG
jgi:hypothetical protein